MVAKFFLAIFSAEKGESSFFLTIPFLISLTITMTATVPSGLSPYPCVPLFLLPLSRLQLMPTKERERETESVFFSGPSHAFYAY